MAQLTITVPDTAVPRIRTALGHIDPQTQQWVDATQAEVLAAVKAFLKERVIAHETTQTAIADRNARSAEQW